MQVTVTGNIGLFTKGQVLTDKNTICEYYRTILSEGAEEPVEVSDQQILATIEEIPGDDEDTEIERIQSLETEG